LNWVFSWFLGISSTVLYQDEIWLWEAFIPEANQFLHSLQKKSCQSIQKCLDKHIVTHGVHVTSQILYVQKR
jgi:hypothetical protein